MTDVDPGLTHGVRLLHHLDEASFLQILDSFQFSKVVKGCSIELEGETRAVTRVFSIHQQLVNLLDQLHT